MTAKSADAEQLAYWNGPAGQRWVRRQEQQDALLQPISTELLRRAAVTAGERVIDCGCGCGQTTTQLAERAGVAGHVLGIDISAPMLERACELTPSGRSMTYVEADAATFPFAPASANILFSRFGVMFFAEPARAFANMHTALVPGGRVALVCWRSAAENPWFTLPLEGVARHVPELARAQPDAPGPFAFQRADRVREILQAAGFERIAIEAEDFQIDLADSCGLQAAVESALSIGPASRALEGQPADIRAAAAVSVADVLRPHLAGSTVTLRAGVWFVSARSGVD